MTAPVLNMKFQGKREIPVFSSKLRSKNFHKEKCRADRPGIWPNLF